MLKEDSVQIPSQRSRISSFRPDGPVMRLNGPIMHPNTHQCPEPLNNSRLHPSGHCDNASGCSLEFDKKSDFLYKHRHGKTTTSVWTTGQYRPDAILDKVRHGEELQLFGRQGNTFRTRSLLWYLCAAEVQPFGR